MIEELEEPDRQVLPVRQPAQPVPFVRIGQQHGLLAVVAKGVVESEPVDEADGRIGRPVHDEERRGHVRGVGEGRLEMVSVGPIPGREAPAALIVEVILERCVAAPALVAVSPAPGHAEIVVQVDDAGSHPDGGEHLGHRPDEGRALAAVAVAGDADLFRVDIAHLDDLARRRFDAFQHIGMRGPGAEVDIRKHGQVAVAHGLDRHPAHAGEIRRSAVNVHVLRVLLVEDHEHGPLLARLVVVRDGQDALQSYPVLILEVEEQAMAPQIILLLRIGIGDFFRIPGRPDRRRGGPEIRRTSGG